MSIAAREELAMVLPIPVKAKSGEDVVRFISLKNHPTIFDALEAGFPPPPSKSRGLTPKTGFPTLALSLAVHEVGDFQASFVPGISAFSRLDKRFQLSPGTWEKLPQYRTYGFAVFKLSPARKTIHPMAFSFPRANPKELFFPTVHIHDGEVHPKADFDHVLYCQRNRGESFRLSNWRESPQLAKSFVDVAKSQRIVDSEQHCHRLQLQGSLKNADTILI
jgi:hypothetical protein